MYIYIYISSLVNGHVHRNGCHIMPDFSVKKPWIIHDDSPRHQLVTGGVVDHIQNPDLLGHILL